MHFTLRLKKNIWSASVFAGFLLAANLSARAANKPATESAGQPNGAVASRANTPPTVVRVGKIEIPTVGLAATVLEGADARILRLAVGHIPGTAVPGPSGNVGLAAHNNTFFRCLRNINLGDEIRYSTEDGTFTYRVTSLSIVLPSAVEVLNSTPQPTLTLVTCYPFNSIHAAPKRLIVHAEIVTSDLNQKN
jgi:sortase A